MTTLYGIPNCDTVKKARRWLEAHHIDYRFHDLREDPVSRDTLQRWLVQLGSELLLNRRSTTWKQLPEGERPDGTDSHAVIDCLQQHPTLIKRPVLEHGQQVRAGFSATDYTSLFQP